MFRIYPYVCNRKQTKDKMKDMKYDIPALTAEAVGLLKALISIPSVSRDEEKAADCLQQYIELQGMQTGRKGNNVRHLSPMFDLNKPNESYSN